MTDTVNDVAVVDSLVTDVGPAVNSAEWGAWVTRQVVRSDSGEYPQFDFTPILAARGVNWSGLR